MESFWNDRYSTEDYVYGTSPNVFFREQIDKLEPGMILMPGEGEGRNSVYAANRGWIVDAIDYSEMGRQKAMALARDKSLFINYTVADITEIELEENFYDAAAIIFLHLDSAERTVFHEKLRKSIKPGGKLIMEVFSGKQLENNSGGPANIDKLYSIDEIKNEFPGFVFGILEEKDDVLLEGQFHNGKASLIRAVAEKKNNY